MPYSQQILNRHQIDQLATFVAYQDGVDGYMLWSLRPSAHQIRGIVTRDFDKFSRRMPHLYLGDVCSIVEGMLAKGHFEVNSQLRQFFAGASVISTTDIISSTAATISVCQEERTEQVGEVPQFSEENIRLGLSEADLEGEEYQNQHEVHHHPEAVPAGIAPVGETSRPGASSGLGSDLSQRSDAGSTGSRAAWDWPGSKSSSSGLNTSDLGSRSNLSSSGLNTSDLGPRSNSSSSGLNTSDMEASCPFCERPW